MYQNHNQTFRQLVQSTRISEKALESIIIDLQKDLGIQKLFGYVAQLANNLGKGTQPFVRVNSITIATKLLNIANYSYLLLAEIYLMPHIQKVIDFLASNAGLQQQTQYFQLQGYSLSIPFLQNLSYNFVTQSSEFVQLAAKIKPFRVYQGKQYSQSSIFRKYRQKITKQLDQNQFPLKLNKSTACQSLRQKYLLCLSNWNQQESCLLQFFVKIIEQYLCCGIEQKKYKISFNDILKYGQPIVTSEIIARLIEIVSSSYNFKIRTRALKLIDNLILLGDIQALLVVNFTEHIQIVVMNIIYVNGEISLDQGMKIYPQISGQEDDKLQFYTFMLRCIQVWAECYPNNDYFDYQNKMKKGQSVVYRLYKLLKQTKKFKFPNNLMIARYEKQTHANMKEKMIRNQMILIDINGQTQSISILLEQQKSFKEVQEFYQTHKQCLLFILNNGTKDLSQNMHKLLNFKENFQQYVQSITTTSGDNQGIDQLIENGLELIDLIQAIHQPYVLYLRQIFTGSQFNEVVTNICFKYFNVEEQKQNQGHFERFLSQKLKIKRNQMQFLKIRSTPQDNELKMIVSDLNTKQLRAKYKKKREKNQDTRGSQSSVLILQIQTRTKFPKASGESIQNYKKDSSLIKSQTSLKDIVSSNQNKKEIQNGNSQNPQNEGNKGIKKRIKIVSKQLNSNDKNASLISSKNSQSSTEKTNIKAENKIQNRNFKVSTSENQQYFQYLRQEQLKYSYTLSHIIIFKSEKLMVERTVCQVIEENKIKLKVYIILIPHVDLSNITYTVEDQGCILISDSTKAFPQHLKAQCRHIIELVGQMKKIPLKLPTIAIFVDKILVFQYILPFTINFFFDCYSNQTQVLSNFRAIQNIMHNQFSSQPFNCSPVLFPQENIDKIFLYFPFMIKLSKAEAKKDIFLWQVRHNDLRFLIVVEYFKEERQMKVKLQTSVTSGQIFFAFFKYVLNYMVHLLGDFSHKRN